MRLKIKKNIEGAANFFWFEVKLKRKITLIKGKKLKEWGPNWKKIMHHKLWLKDKIENK